ncbi:hypothetical protein C2E23DRAFT_477047 [Lenzites betulinus]|nr:hypothetical protein C2E23DRAFT_477047 [Lenzites betulinus]
MVLHAAPYRVQLQPDSLYIATTPLLNSFHWALIHIDQNGVATRHHWAAMSTSSSNPQGPGAYIEQALPHGPLSKINNDCILAYFKISDCSPIGVAELRRECSSIFRTSYPAAQETRLHHVTCRTWITHILGRLLGPKRAQDIEEFVQKHSTTCSNMYASDFLFQRAYEVQVYTL